MGAIDSPQDLKPLRIWLLPLLSALLILAIGLSGSNRELFLAINHAGAALPAALWALLTTFGDSLAIFSFGLLMLGRRPQLLWSLFLSALIAAVAVHSLKELSDAYGLYRPANYYSAEEIRIIGDVLIRVTFPSGHTTAAFTLVALLWLQTRIHLGLKLGLLGLALLVGLSRMAVGAHWPQDVLGGMLIAWLSAVAGTWLAPRIAWGTTPGAQRFFAGLLLFTALYLVLGHDSGFEQARWLEMAIGAACLVGAVPGLRRVFTRTESERQAAVEALEEGDEAEEEARGGSLSGVLLRLVVTAVIFALIFRDVDFEGVAQTLRNVVPRLLLLGVIFQMLSTLLAAYRWNLVMRPLNFSPDFPFYLRSYFKGMFFNQALPTSIGGDAIRVLDVARTGYRKREAFYGVFVDRLLGLTGLLLLNLLANLFNSELLPRGVFYVINAIVGAGLLGVVGLHLFHRVPWFQRWRLLRLFHILSEKLATVLDSLRAGGIQLGLSMAVHGLSLMAIFLIGRSVELEYDLLTFLVIVPPVILLTLVPVSLAGWGVRESGMIGLFTLIGADKTLVLSMSILYGIVLIVASLPGLFVYLTGKHRI